MFGGTINAGLVGGIMRLDSSYREIGVFDNTTPVTKRVFYLGIQGGFSMAGLAGFTIRIGLSELGPLQVFLNVEIAHRHHHLPADRADPQRLLRRRGVLQDAAEHRRPVRAAQRGLRTADEP